MEKDSVWVNTRNGWVRGTLLPGYFMGKSKVLVDDTGQVFTNCTNSNVKELLAAKKDIQLIVPGSLQVVDDLITLDELNEPVLLHNLKERYLEDKIYVSLIFVGTHP
jgi:myosin heavy subunit